jgi:2-polyprenyl-3-methyl-5-hydroxy-6-metoxy-1,4-benzoquinol methylase
MQEIDNQSKNVELNLGLPKSLTEEIATHQIYQDELKRKSLGKLADNLFAIERKNVQQSRLFIIDLIPYIYRLYYNWPTDKPVRVLDIGIECGAGTALLAELHNRRSHNYLKMEVTGLDIVEDFRDYISVSSPFVKFVKKDIFDIPDGETWDLVICSHVIEHIKDPFAFIDKLRRLTSKYTIVACPYNETNLRPGHVQTIDEAFISQVAPLEHHIYTNFCWRSRGKCLIMILESTNGH